MDETICYSFEDFLNLFNEYAETTQEERKTKLLENRDYYHAANGLPDWFADSLDAFKRLKHSKFKQGIRMKLRNRERLRCVNMESSKTGMLSEVLF